MINDEPFPHLIKELLDIFLLYGNNAHSILSDPEKYNRIIIKMAGNIAWRFLGDEWMKKNIINADRDKSFFLSTGAFGPKIANDAVRKSVIFSDSLFDLRFCENFSDLIIRIQQRDQRTCFMEAMVASMLLSGTTGCLSIRKETGKMGEDFDFDLEVDGNKIAVEVTSKSEDAPLTERSILNTLNDKRKRISRNIPSILYIVVPVSWQKMPNWVDIFESSTQKFFCASKRINVVIAVHEGWVFNLDGNNTYTWIGMCKRFINSSARHKFDTAIFTDDIIGDGDSFANILRSREILGLSIPNYLRYIINIADPSAKI